MRKIISLLLVVSMSVAIALSISICAAKKDNKDINGDGEVDNKDVVTLFRYVSKGEKGANEALYDLDEDGDVNNKDVVGLFRFLSDMITSETEGKKDGLYKIFLYDKSEGSSIDSYYEQYTGKDFLGIAEESKKNDVENKTVQIFGKVYTLKYTRTLDFEIYDEKYDRYYGNGASFMFGEKTGRLVSYTNHTDEPEEGFIPPVNVLSTRQDFIDYAKYLLLTYFETSTDDCDVEIKIRKLKTTYKYTEEELQQGFVNFIEQDPNFMAEYRILFYKKLSGINRIDDIEVDISNTGKVLWVKSRTCNEKFEQFNNVTIDKNILRKNATDVIFDDTDKVLIRAIPDGNELWVLIDVENDYTDGEDTYKNSIQYITKVVESPAVS